MYVCRAVTSAAAELLLFNFRKDKTVAEEANSQSSQLDE